MVRIKGFFKNKWVYFGFLLSKRSQGIENLEQEFKVIWVLFVILDE